jgi:hypothetical protein
MLRLLLKIPFAVVYALGIVIMVLGAIPFFVIGFISGFVKWTWQAGNNLADRLFLQYR